MKNVFLIIGMSAVVILCVFLFLYDYIPSGLNVTKANTYETNPKTAEILSDSQAIQSTLSSQGAANPEDAAASAVQGTVLFTNHEVTGADIALASRTGVIDQGRPDPFAEITAEEMNAGSGSTGTPTSGNSTVTPDNGTGNTGSSDGTFYNTAKQK